MEEKDFSSGSEMEMEYENVNETEMLKSGYFRDLLREKIKDCLNEERKKNVKLDKLLFELEVEKYNLLLKEKKSKRGRPLKSISKLEDLIKLYSMMKDIDKKFVDIKSYYYKYFDEVLIINFKDYIVF